MRSSIERRAAVLESVLTCFMDRDRAEAITGDLKESAVTATGDKFRQAALRLVASLLARSMALCAVGELLTYGSQALQHLSMLFLIRHVDQVQMRAADWLQGYVGRMGVDVMLDDGFLICALLSAAMIPLVLRFGARSRISLLIMMFLPFFLLEETYRCPVGVYVIFWGVRLALVVFALSMPAWRKSMLIIMGAVTIGLMMFYAVAALTVFFQPDANRLGYWVILYAAELFSVFVMCMSCSWLHGRWVLGDEQQLNTA